MEKKENLEQQVEQKLSFVMRSPYITSTIILTFFMIIVGLMFKSQYDEVQSTIKRIELTANDISKIYNNFNNQQNEYITHIDNIALKVIKLRPETSNYEDLYINYILNRITTLSDDANFNNNKNIELMNFISNLLNNDFNNIKIVYDKTKDEALKIKILKTLDKILYKYKVSGKIFITNNTSYAAYNTNKITFPYEKAKYINSQIKSNLMNKLLMYIGKKYNQNIDFISTYKLLLNNLNPSAKLDNNFIFKDLLRNSFEFYIMHNKNINIEQIKKDLSLELSKKLFGNEVTPKRYNSLINNIKTIASESTLKEKVNKYNTYIVISWYNALKTGQLISLRTLILDDIKDK